MIFAFNLNLDKGDESEMELVLFAGATLAFLVLFDPATLDLRLLFALGVNTSRDNDDSESCSDGSDTASVEIDCVGLVIKAGLDLT